MHISDSGLNIEHYSIDDIKKKVEELALKIKAPDDSLPGFGKLKHEAFPYIEVDNSGTMSFVISERGIENERKTTNDPDKLLYWIFSSITFSMACKFESKNRIEDKDCRRIMFGKQEELLGKLSNAWRQKEKEKHRQILEKHPYDDLASLRATYFGMLREKGYSESKISKLAFEQYPL